MSFTLQSVGRHEGLGNIMVFNVARFLYLRSLIFITLITDLGSVANLPNNQQSAIPATKLHAFDISCQLIMIFTIDITEVTCEKS